MRYQEPHPSQRRRPRRDLPWRKPQGVPAVVYCYQTNRPKDSRQKRATPPESHSSWQIQDFGFLHCASDSGNPPGRTGLLAPVFLKLPDCILRGREYDKDYSRKVYPAGLCLSLSGYMGAGAIF